MAQDRDNFYPREDFDEVQDKHAKIPGSDLLESTTAYRSQSVSKENHDDSIQAIKINLNSTL